MKESTKGGSFRVALIQIHSIDNIKENLIKIEKNIREAAAAGAEFIMLPETAEYIGRRMKENAVENPAKLSEFYGKLAGELHVYLHCGSFTERVGDGKPSNTSLLFDPEGKQIADYSKIHLFDVDVTDGPSFQESKKILAGDHLSLAETKLGNIGMAICYDIRFPQMFSVMAKGGAEIFTIAANFTKPTGKAHWEPLLRARAIENTAYVLACNQCGVNTVCEAYGHSMVIDPWGNILAEAGEQEEILYATIDPAEIVRVRREMPSLANVREDIYTLESGAIRTFL